MPPGLGTALKPAHEPIVVARKPLSGTVSQTVLEHGTGALNVDGCRIGYEAGGSKASNPSLRDSINGGNGGHVIAHEPDRRVVIPDQGGRWPANVVISHKGPDVNGEGGCKQTGTRRVKGHAGYPNGPRGNQFSVGETPDGSRTEPWPGHADADGLETVPAWACEPDCPVRILDEQTGKLTSGDGNFKRTTGADRNGNTGAAYGAESRPAGAEMVSYGDSGGASRFMKTVGFSIMDEWPPPGERSEPRTDISASTSAGRRTESSDDDSLTDGSGSKPTDRSRPGMTSTTETGIPSTTTSPTLNQSKGERTSGSMEPSEPPRSSETASGSAPDAKSGSHSMHTPSGPGHPGSPTAGSVERPISASGEQPIESTTTPISASITSGQNRFRYTAKASSAERGAGLDGDRNIHPTCKPVDLMRWLIRLVTPPDGLVLDPFLGSGTTGCAAVLENFRFVGIEQDPEYVAIAEARIAWWAKHGASEGSADEIATKATLAAGKARDDVAGSGQGSLFGGD